MKRCDHARAKRDSAVWATLAKVGVQHVPAGEDPIAEPAYTIELRNCACGSTLCKEIRS